MLIGVICAVTWHMSSVQISDVLDVWHIPVAPVENQVILESGVGQFREFETPRVHTRINSWGLFVAHKLTCGIRGSVS